MTYKIRKKPRMNRKFRFQLMSEFILSIYDKCRVADIGGGKGLLSYILNDKGWDSIVIDPFDQKLKHKYKDIQTGKRVKLSRAEITGVKRLSSVFDKNAAKDFDLLIGLHAHGSNIKIIQAAAEYGKDFAILPCCVIDEPVEKVPGVNWLDSLFDYASELGLSPKKATLNFAGQRTVIFTANHIYAKSLQKSHEN